MVGALGKRKRQSEDRTMTEENQLHNGGGGIFRDGIL